MSSQSESPALENQVNIERQAFFLPTTLLNVYPHEERVLKCEA